MYYLWVRRLIHPVNNTGPWITLFFCPAVWLVCIKSFLKKATHMELWHQPPGKHLSLFSLIQWFSSSTAVCFIHHFTSMCLLGKRLFSSRWNSRDSGISFWIFFFLMIAWRLVVFPWQPCDWEGEFEWWLSARKIEHSHGDTFYPARVYFKCRSIISLY